MSSNFGQVHLGPKWAVVMLNPVCDSVLSGENDVDSVFH